MVKKATISDIKELESKFGIKIGKQLASYLMNKGYAYLNGRELISFLEIEEINLIERELCESLKDYIVVEGDGFGNSRLVDSNDNLFFFNHENKSINSLNKKFNDEYNYFKELIQ